MHTSTLQQAAVFFNAIETWRAAYRTVHLTYLARAIDEGDGERLQIISASLSLDVMVRDQPSSDAWDSTWESAHRLYRVGPMQAGCIDLSHAAMQLEQVVAALLSPQGLPVEGHGALLLAPPEAGSDARAEAAFALHESEQGAARAVRMQAFGRSMVGSVDAQIDWIVRGGSRPFESLAEMAAEYGLDISGTYTRLDLVAHTAIQVFAGSAIFEDSASIGIWAPQALDKSRLRLGYRVLDQDQVVLRHSIAGADLLWSDAGVASVGRWLVPVGSANRVQCIASYHDVAHHHQWVERP